MITLAIGFEKVEDDKTLEFAFTGDTASKTAIEKGIANFLTFSGEADGWTFVNWKGAGKSGTLFNEIPSKAT
jgi:hypothetical protein